MRQALYLFSFFYCRLRIPKRPPCQSQEIMQLVKLRIGQNLFRKWR